MSSLFLVGFCLSQATFSNGLDSFLILLFLLEGFFVLWMPSRSHFLLLSIIDYTHDIFKIWINVNIEKLDQIWCILTSPPGFHFCSLVGWNCWQEKKWCSFLVSFEHWDKRDICQTWKSEQETIKWVSHNTSSEATVPLTPLYHKGCR